MVNQRIFIKYKGGRFSFDFEEKRADGTVFETPRSYDGLISILFNLFALNMTEPYELRVTEGASEAIKNLRNGSAKLKNLYNIINLQRDLSYFNQSLIERIVEAGDPGII